MKFLTGTVYSKALAIFLAAALGLLGAVVGLSQLIILREFNLSERREMKATLQRFSYMIGREIASLDAAVVELAKSPLMVAAFKDGSELTRELRVLADSDVDFFVFYDGSGNYLRAKSNRKPGEAEVEQMEETFRTRADISSLKIDRTGFLGIGDRLAIVSLSPIDAGRETPAGYILGGRVLDQETFGFLEGLFLASVRFNPFRDTKVNETTGREMVELLNSNEVVIEEAGAGQIVGYRLVKDLAGSPIGFISVSQARPLRQEGLRAVQVFLTGIVLAGGALVFVVWILLDRTILARIKDLTRKLDTEKRSGRLPVRLNFKGSDELGVLAEGIENLAVLLQNTHFLYRSVLEDQTELICRFDHEYRLTFANAIFLRLFKLDSLALSSCSLPGFLSPEAWLDVSARFQKLSRESPLLHYTHEMQMGDRQASPWFRSTLRRNYANDGTLAGGQWVLADITAQVSAQRKMIESERRFRRLFESASDGLLLLDGDTLTVSDINSSLCRMLMVAGSEILGRRLEQLPAFAPCLDAVNSHRRQGLDNGLGLRSECRLSRGDETSLFVELRCGGYDVDGVEYVQLSFRNISERVLGERELRRLSAKLLRLQDDERRRIARELHDSTAQNLSALEMNMSLLEPLVEKSNPRAARIVAETRQIAGECSREIRNISYLLHPPLIDEVGLAFAIKWFADGFSKRTGIAATVEIDPCFPRLDSEMEMPLFRIVQEAMTNIYRHSGADQAWVKLQYDETRLILVEIRDNGRGFGDGVLTGDGAVDDRRVGVGLAGMKERLANFGGKLEIESSPFGATLTIRVILDLGEPSGNVGLKDTPPQFPSLVELP